MVFDMMKTKLRSLDVAITSAESLTNEYFIGIVQQILNSSKKIKDIIRELHEMSDNNSDAVAERGLTTKESVVMFIDELNTILNNIESDYHLDIDHENTDRLQAKKGYQREASSIRGSLMENYSDNGKIAHDMYFGFYYCTMSLLDRLIGTKHYYEVIQDLEVKRYYNKILFQKYNFESNKKYLEA